MNKFSHFVINDKWILKKRGKKNKVDPFKPYAYFVEKERTASGQIEDTAVIFLTNYECPFRCLMCDLWKNTTDKPVPIGAIPKQIEWALNHLPPAKHLKLYNSGNFFDKKAIPEQDYEKIGSLVEKFETLIIENHPKLINEKNLSFAELLKPKLQVAIGLETVHPEILKKLNKKMNPEDFKNAVQVLNKKDISVRSFILLSLPFLSESEGEYWAKKSIDFAYDSGAECCTVIPTRMGNGAMESLFENKLFSLPSIQTLENVIEYGIELKAGRIFSDIWDIELFSKCTKCTKQRKERLIKMNFHQKIIKKVKCDCEF